MYKGRRISSQGGRVPGQKVPGDEGISIKYNTSTVRVGQKVVECDSL